MPEDSYKHKGLRRKLIKIVESKGIKDESVLRALNAVPRHLFLDNAFLEHAYQDKAFPIGEGQTISQPYTVAFQSKLLQIKPGDKVLEVGTGSGYQASVLMELGAKVFTIEYNKPLYLKTKKFLPSIGYSPLFKHGDGSKGWPIHAPYDAILVTAGAPSVPTELVKQLKPSGRLVIPVGNNERQLMLRITKTKDNQIKQEQFDYFSFVPLLGADGWNS